jgi:DNA invertase Pin-like site-specific DNA recombinase
MKAIAYSYGRFSSDKQELGDSKRRQDELVRKYCIEHDLELSTLNMFDAGVSAFHGQHRKNGALGTFTKLVTAGKITPGSVLLIENIDRLSREASSDALTLFLTIINNGLKLVLLEHNKEITKQSFDENAGDFYMIMGEIRRANEESKRKSYLVGNAWKQKKRLATEQGVYMTRKIPHWLVLSDDKKTCTPIPEAAKTIKLIYKMRLAGKGKDIITKELNLLGDKIWRPRKSPNNPTGKWNTTYVNDILRTRHVLGEFQPMKRIAKGLREPDGEPIKDYYPAIIDQETFDNVQAAIADNAKRMGKGGGRTGRSTNLFANVITCGVCGSPMYLLTWSKHYLYCKNRYMNKECEAKPVLYEEVEKLIFQNLEELTVSDLLPESNEILDMLEAIKTQITAKEYHLQTLTTGIENISDTIFKTKDEKVRKILEQKLSNAIVDKEATERTVIELQQEERSITQQANELDETLNVTMQIYELLKSNPDNPDLRIRIRSEIRKLIKRIDIHPIQKYVKESVEIEPGVYETMNSRYIDKIRIRFNGSKNLRILYLRTISTNI